MFVQVGRGASGSMAGGADRVAKRSSRPAGGAGTNTSEGLFRGRLSRRRLDRRNPEPSGPAGISAAIQRPAADRDRRVCFKEYRRRLDRQLRVGRPQEYVALACSIFLVTGLTLARGTGLTCLYSTIKLCVLIPLYIPPLAIGVASRRRTQPVRLCYTAPRFSTSWLSRRPPLLYWEERPERWKATMICFASLTRTRCVHRTPLP